MMYLRYEQYIFSKHSMERLSMEEQRELCQFLPLCDVDQDTRLPTQHLFTTPSFQESVREFQGLVEQGFLLPSKNIEKMLQESHETNRSNGIDTSRMHEFWLDVAAQLSMSWVSDLDQDQKTCENKTMDDQHSDKTDDKTQQSVAVDLIIYDR